MGSRRRHDRWIGRDRFPAAALVIYLLGGLAHNYVRTSPRFGEDVRRAFIMGWMVFLALVLLFFGWEILWRRRAVETLGFKVAPWPSSTLTVGVGAYLAILLLKVPLTAAAFTAGIALPFLAVLLEEMLVRPVLISRLHDLFKTRERSWALAVVLSAAIWTAMHLPSKSPSMLVGLFIAGVFVGALYVWSGTNVAGYVLHALANSGSGGAVIMFVLCLVLAAAGRLTERRPGRDLASPGDRVVV